MWMASCVIWEGQGCRSVGEHDQGEGSFGAVESVGPPGHRADLVIESFMAAVRELPFDRGTDAVLVLADPRGGLDEVGARAALDPQTPAVDRVHDVGGGQAASDPRAQVSLGRVGPPQGTTVAA